MSSEQPGVTGLTQRELLLEMREDIRGSRRPSTRSREPRRSASSGGPACSGAPDSIYARLDGHDRDLDRMLVWQNRADGALVLARWALGASLVSLVAVALQVLATVGHAMNGGIP